MKKLNGLMKKTACTQISSPAVNWKPKAYRFRHSDATGCAEVKNKRFSIKPCQKAPVVMTGAFLNVLLLISYSGYHIFYLRSLSMNPVKRPGFS